MPTSVQTSESVNCMVAGKPWLGYVQLGIEPAAEGLVQGKDYFGRLYTQAESFPAKTAMAWSLPERPTKSGRPWGYLHLANGLYQYAKPPVVLPAKKVVDVRSWILSLDTRLTLLSGSASVLWDTYITGSADPIAQTLGELGVFLYPSDAAIIYMQDTTKCSPIRGGIFTHPDGTQWMAYRANGTGYYMFAPLVPGPGLGWTAALDMKPFLDFLMGAGLVSSAAWLTGSAVGIEVARGAGSWSVNDIRLTQL